MIRFLPLLFALAACTPAAPPPPQEAPPDPRAALERMDGRKPVPLLPQMAHHQLESMRDHLAAVQEVVAALAKDDLEAAARAGARLGTSDQMARMCNHMGAAAPGFTEQALGFHETADGIAAAAAAGDRTGTLAALERTLATCTGCHATWRQQVVDDATFERLAAEARAGR